MIKHAAKRRLREASPAAEEPRGGAVAPAPQAGLDKWLAYADMIGLDIPESARENKAAIRALVEQHL